MAQQPRSTSAVLFAAQRLARTIQQQRRVESLVELRQGATGLHGHDQKLSFHSSCVSSGGAQLAPVSWEKERLHLSSSPHGLSDAFSRVPQEAATLCSPPSSSSSAGIARIEGKDRAGQGSHLHSVGRAEFFHPCQEPSLLKGRSSTCTRINSSSSSGSRISDEECGLPDHSHNISSLRLPHTAAGFTSSFRSFLEGSHHCFQPQPYRDNSQFILPSSGAVARSTTSLSFASRLPLSPATATFLWPTRFSSHSVRSLSSSLIRHSPSSIHVGAEAGPDLFSLNQLRDNTQKRDRAKRLGRGIGSGKGKTAGRGHKGQKARSGNKPRIGFEGGQTPLRLTLPKRGFHNPFSMAFQELNLKTLAEKIQEGRIDPTEVVTMKHLKDAGAIGKAWRDGVKLLGRGGDDWEIPVHLEVSRVTLKAKEAIERAGGSVTRVHFNRLGLRALYKPDWFAKKGRLLPKMARPPPRLRPYVDAIGRLPGAPPARPLPPLVYSKRAQLALSS
eukprot:TRINITY_DN528_c0_g6_i1.p1 TRINITY_DN528_c0_g6~~TRINITY_DN528_c0_g6_i1.p1  ORF type:complete len:501 (+),score=53.62 TRINITY_DN528_c0_g6_i1:374-1876(+)